MTINFLPLIVTVLPNCKCTAMTLVLHSYKSSLSISSTTAFVRDLDPIAFAQREQKAKLWFPQSAGAHHQVADNLNSESSTSASNPNAVTRKVSRGKAETLLADNATLMKQDFICSCSEVEGSDNAFRWNVVSYTFTADKGGQYGISLDGSSGQVVFFVDSVELMELMIHSEITLHD